MNLSDINKTELLYVASPLYDPDPAIRKERISINRIYCQRLIEKGIIFFAPLLHSEGYSGNPEYWYRHGLEMLKRCDSMLILEIDGHEKSKGVKLEVKLAKKMGITIFRESEKEIQLTMLIRCCTRWAKSGDTVV